MILNASWLGGAVTRGEAAVRHAARPGLDRLRRACPSRNGDRRRHEGRDARVVRPPHGRCGWRCSFLTVVWAKALVLLQHPVPVPFWDQWDGEGAMLYIPWWHDGLTWRQMFALHNEHRIFFSRLLAVALLVLNGQWDPHLQILVNAVHPGARGRRARRRAVDGGRAATPAARRRARRACRGAAARARELAARVSVGVLPAAAVLAARDLADDRARARHGGVVRWVSRAPSAACLPSPAARS